MRAGTRAETAARAVAVETAAAAVAVAAEGVVQAAKAANSQCQKYQCTLQRSVALLAL